MKQYVDEISVRTKGQGFVDVTDRLAAFVEGKGAADGLLTLLLRHTSASLIIQENADPDVVADLGDALSRLAPEGPDYRHDAEGPDDMPAHIRAALTSPQLSIPVRGGRLQLGTWQAVYVAEHRRAPHERRIALHYLAG